MADASGECEFTEENDEISEEYSSCFFKKKKKIRNYIAVKTELKDQTEQEFKVTNNDSLRDKGGYWCMKWEHTAIKRLLRILV